MYTKYKENLFAGFFNTTVVGKILENVQECFYWSLILQNYDWWVPMTWGLNPYFI